MADVHCDNVHAVQIDLEEMRLRIERVIRELEDGIPEHCYSLLYDCIVAVYGEEKALSMDRLVDATDGEFYLENCVNCEDVCSILKG